MLPVDIICPRCGWRNETTARMCGGCGRPLVSVDPSATSSAPASPTAYDTPSAPAAVSGDAPTVLEPLVTSQPPPPVRWDTDGVPVAGHAVSPAPPLSPAPAARATAAPWPGPGGPKGSVVSTRTPPATRSGRLKRVALAVSLVLVVLLVGLLGAWALVIRPAIHTALDGQIRSSLTGGVQQAVAPLSALSGASIPPTDVTITATDINQRVAADLPSGIPVSDVAVHFAGGQAHITYSFWGSAGAVTTTLALAGGRPVASGTTVDCPLCLVESGDEMQAAFDAALAQIPTSLKVTRIATQGDALVITVKSGS